MSKGLVIGFVGQQSQEVLSWSSSLFGSSFNNLGYTTEIINLFDRDSLIRAGHFLQSNDVYFGFGFAGVGARLKAQGVSLWDHLRVPFLSLLGDHPAYNPLNHCIDSRYVSSVYWTKDFYDTQQHYLRSKQPTFLLPPTFSTNPLKPEFSWHERPIQYLFLKNGSDPNALADTWKDWPKSAKEIIWDCIQCCEARTDLLIAHVVAERLGYKPEHIEIDNKYFWDVVQLIDDYLRRKRMTWMARLLTKTPAHIMGDGWEYIDKENSKAQFLPSIKAHEVLPLFLNTKFTFNTNPYFNHNVHERVFHGLNAQNYVVSDNNKFSEDHLSSLECFFGFDWADPHKDERILDFIQRTDLPPPHQNNVKPVVDGFCDSNSSLEKIISIVNKIRSQSSSSYLVFFFWCMTMFSAMIYRG